MGQSQIFTLFICIIILLLIYLIIVLILGVHNLIFFRNLTFYVYFRMIIIFRFIELVFNCYIIQWDYLLRLNNSFIVSLVREIEFIFLIILIWISFLSLLLLLTRNFYKIIQILGITQMTYILLIMNLFGSSFYFFNSGFILYLFTFVFLLLSLLSFDINRFLLIQFIFFIVI